MGLYESGVCFQSVLNAIVYNKSVLLVYHTESVLYPYPHPHRTSH